MHAHGAMLAVSICICTYNRERLLRQTLSRLGSLIVPEDVTLEVVVIDNNSTDSTARVIAEAPVSLTMRTARETTPGIAHARNAAVALATGELLLWIDDDVLVEPEWLRRYVRSARANPGAGIFGGPVRPLFEGTPPAWITTLLPEIRQAYALRDFPPGRVHVDLDHLPYGANFGTRRAVHQRIRFNPALGRVGADGGCLSEESEFFEVAISMGYSGEWIADNPVEHVIPVERQTIRYLRRYYVLSGATPAAVPDGAVMMLGRPRWLWREWIQNEVAFFLLRHTTAPARWFSHLKRASYARGALFDRQRP